MLLFDNIILDFKLRENELAYYDAVVDNISSVDGCACFIGRNNDTIDFLEGVGNSLKRTVGGLAVSSNGDLFPVVIVGHLAKGFQIDFIDVI